MIATEGAPETGEDKMNEKDEEEDRVAVSIQKLTDCGRIQCKRTRRRTLVDKEEGAKKRI